MKNRNIFKKLGGEFLCGILNIFAATFETKVSFGLYLLIIGITILVSPKIQGIETLIQYVVGSILILFAIFLFIWRIEELNNEKNQNK